MINLSPGFQLGDGQKIKKYTIIDVLKSRKLRLITLLCLTLW